MENNEQKEEKLTTKQEAFCVHYTTIGEETFGNGGKSAIAAGYSEAGSYARASELLRNRKIINRINELHTENMTRNQITVDKILSDLEHDKLLARKNHQYAVAKGCTELQGRYLAMFTDVQKNEYPGQEPPPTEEEQKAAYERSKARTEGPQAQQAPMPPE